jgi:hypothetical protein
MAKKVPPNPVTVADADGFAMAVMKWQDLLNLHDWRIERSAKPAAKSNMAEINSFDLKARLATYRIGADFGSVPVTETSVDKIACHEVLHVFLHELLEAGEDEIDSAEHRVINTLVRLLVDKQS